MNNKKVFLIMFLLISTTSFYFSPTKKVYAYSLDEISKQIEQSYMINVSQNKKIDNSLLDLYNKNIITQEACDFRITLNDNWTKPNYESIYNFSKSDIGGTIITTHKSFSLLMLSIGKIANEHERDVDIQINLALEEFSLNQSFKNFSSIKKSKLSGVDFRYFKFGSAKHEDMKNNYLYVGVKDDNMYLFVVLDVKEESKSDISKALKSIVLGKSSLLGAN